MVNTKAGARSRALIARVFKEEGIPLLWYSDDYSDDLPHWYGSFHNMRGMSLISAGYRIREAQRMKACSLFP